MSRPVALVTGVGRPQGIGAGIARALAREGWDLALSRWQPADDAIFGADAARGLEAVIADARNAGARIVDIPVDLQRTDAAASLFDAAHAELGTVSGLVLSHAWDVESGILDTTVEEFDRHVAVNARASWLLIRQFAQQADAGGAIVALTSDHTTGNLPYGASKGALDRIVISAARELAPQGISANVLNPGPIDTGWMTDEVRATLTGMQPGGRLGAPADVAEVVAFLVSPRGRWVTGQLLSADGGFSISI
ncbi:SDR family oxidoreductase [Microbacterium sp. zg.B48]|uniref:SDR family oxidoreductase n=1 Tax=Microbacterium sp. zg.B48 TaxID=2969408 RepID=UPI00214AB407|nr:SDR family oxidoreductase [Microbacterium sp. zg.B48]MCR2763745.1 SDR family oxidoreductase [Microbacterium sp. zg.B48]